MKFTMNLTKNTGRFAGYSILLMFILGITTLMGLDSKIIVKGDTAATINNITTYKFDFWIGIIGYLIILILDVIFSLAIYVIFKSTNKSYSLITSVLRLVYTAVALVCLIALAFYYSNVYVNGLLIAYFFFVLHLFFLGITILITNFVPKFFGILLVVASPFYIIMIYGHLFLPTELFNLLNTIVIGPAILAELLLGIWLIVKSKKIPSMTQ
jgi:hypothetical protein